MGNNCSITVHHPSELNELNDSFKIIPTIMSKHRSQIYDKLKDITYDLIIIVCADKMSAFNYNEICSRLCSNQKIVVCVKINRFTDFNKCDTTISNMIRNLKQEFIIKYMTKLTINTITICVHNSTYNIYMNELTKKYCLILIDPVINYHVQPTTINSRLFIILPGDYTNISKAAQYLKKITNNIYVLSDVIANNFCNLSISNLKEINEKSAQWDQITKTILNVIN